MTPLALSITGLLACALGIVACVGWLRAERRAARYWQINVDDAETDLAVRSAALPLLGGYDTHGDIDGAPPLQEITRNLVKRAQDAEAACELLRQSLMRGSAVATWTWPEGKRPTNADATYKHVKTTEGDLLITPESFAAERARADKYLR